MKNNERINNLKEFFEFDFSKTFCNSCIFNDCAIILLSKNGIWIANLDIEIYQAKVFIEQKAENVKKAIAFCT